MHRIAMVAVALAAALLAGCGGDDRRDEVEAYIQKANSIQRQSAKDFKQANDTYLAYSRNKLKGGTAVMRLEQARDNIEKAENRLSAIKPPAEARRLHVRLLRVYSLNIDFAHQTALLARYLQAAGAALSPLDKANRRLRQGLRSRTPGKQADALGEFVRALDRTLRALRSQEVPLVLVPTHGDQVRRLADTRRVSDLLRSALDDQDAKRVAGLLKRFRNLSTARKPRTALARQAIRQYDRRYKQLNEAYAEVTREQGRLQEELS
jgi:outer membrane murein-binding lipoprotein Lpp